MKSRAYSNTFRRSHALDDTFADVSNGHHMEVVDAGGVHSIGVEGNLTSRVKTRTLYFMIIHGSFLLLSALVQKDMNDVQATFNNSFYCCFLRA